MTKYLGEVPPGCTARLFYGGEFIKTDKREQRSFNVAFSPDGMEMFFTYYKATKEKPRPQYEIKTFKLIDGQWIGPERVFFTDDPLVDNGDINFSPDGKYVFFSSDRLDTEALGNIYYSVKTENGWSEPKYADGINTEYNEVYPSFSQKGKIFFHSTRPGGHSQSDIYCAEWNNGHFINVKNLGPSVNSPYGQYDAAIAPDESYILVCTSRPDEDDTRHIYISFQRGENTWTKGISINSQLNAELGASAPTFTADGKYLFFRKRGGKHPGIHWISTDFIENLKKHEI